MRQPVIFRGTLRNKHSKRQKNFDGKNSEQTEKTNSVKKTIVMESLTEPIFADDEISTFIDDIQNMHENDKPKVELSELLKADGDLKKLCDELLD